MMASNAILRRKIFSDTSDGNYRSAMKADGLIKVPPRAHKNMTNPGQAVRVVLDYMAPLCKSVPSERLCT